MLTKVQNKAARLSAEGWLSLPAIATQCDVSRGTILNWQKLPDFKAKVNELRQAYAEKIKSNGVADLLNRIRASNIRWRKMMRLANQVKNLEDFDSSLMKELREHESHVAEQLGQMNPKENETADRVIRVRPKKKKDADN